MADLNHCAKKKLVSAEQKTLLDVLGLILALALVVRIGWLVFVAVRSGVVRITRAREFSRDTKRFSFWMIVGLKVGSIVLLLAISVKHLARLS